MHIETEGIVLREAPYGNSGKLLTLLTPERGKITALAKGARSLKSPLAPSSNIFTYSRFVLFFNRGRYVVDSAEIIELFFELRNDVAKLSLAQYFLELAGFICHEGIESSEIVKLLSNTLYILSKRDMHLNLIKGIFELKLLHCAGFMPDMEECHSCGKSEGSTFFLNLSEGYIICEDCGSFSKNFGYLPLKTGTLSAMRHILYSDFGKLFSFTLSPGVIHNFSQTTEEFLAAQTEHHKFKTLEFYKSVL